ncbi:protein CURVATURE THYLAKOID 1C, chloroplastic [Quercus suber]|uniref:Protein curvature thylakoid 1c n=1 Tax=Quercus suber TaxID=58331 RepID=A0AAW0KFX1_QUESU
MASIVASLPPPLLLHGRKTLFTTLQKVPVSSIRGFSHIAERQTRVTVIVKATGEGSESSTSLSIVKSVQNVVSCSLSLSLSLSHMVKIFQINDEN